MKSLICLTVALYREIRVASYFELTFIVKRPKFETFFSKFEPPYFWALFWTLFLKGALKSLIKQFSVITFVSLFA